MSEPESRLRDLTDKFRARGGRMTPQRMAILKALLTGNHPTIQDIYALVKRDFPMTSLVTVYRTIALLRDAGEVLEVDPVDSLAHYDGLRPTPHPHLVCTQCGRVADSPDLDVHALTEDINRRADHWVLTQEVHFYGLCPNCQAKKAPEGPKGGDYPTPDAVSPICGYDHPSAESGIAS
jgi:Fur family peroxide stress response transcriptional regulator